MRQNEGQVVNEDRRSFGGAIAFVGSVVSSAKSLLLQATQDFVSQRHRAFSTSVMANKGVKGVRGFVMLMLAALTLESAAQPVRRPTFPLPMNDAEFFGPFRSWLDVKRVFGAKGDGQTDDTEALQKALDAVRPEGAKVAVIFLPSGVYRITHTLRLEREQHAESMHIIIVGEHPDTTVIRWDGEQKGVMWRANAWYAAFRRITFDGAGKARTAVLCGPNFVTYNEFTDMVFRDVAFGIEAGRMDTQGVAETTVTRCRFLRCSQAGISIQNWNSLDWFVWHCLFEDCGYGITNAFGAGNFHVYESVFRCSKNADIGLGHAGYFSLRGNYSENPRAFLITGYLDACHFLTVERNIVVNPSETAIQVHSFGPVLLMDNIIRTKVAPSVWIRPEAGFLSVGNIFTAKDAIPARADALRVGDKMVTFEAVKGTVPQLPCVPPVEKRVVFDLPSTATEADIQNAVNRAAKLRGQRPVVHLPVGVFAIDRPLVIPSGCDVRMKLTVTDLRFHRVIVANARTGVRVEGGRLR